MTIARKGGKNCDRSSKGDICLLIFPFSLFQQGNHKLSCIICNIVCHFLWYIFHSGIFLRTVPHRKKANNNINIPDAIPAVSFELSVTKNSSEPTATFSSQVESRYRRSQK